MRGTALISRTIVVALFLFSGGCQRLLCSDTPGHEVASPNGEFVAGVFLRNCGATAGYVSFAGIRKRQGRFSRDIDDAILVLRGADGPDLKWLDDRNLRIGITREEAAAVMRKESRWNEVAVSYVDAVADSPR